MSIFFFSSARSSAVFSSCRPRLYLTLLVLIIADVPLFPPLIVITWEVWRATGDVSPTDFEVVVVAFLAPALLREGDANPFRLFEDACKS